MSNSGFLSSLNLGTLVIVFLIAVVAFAFFLRRRSNRRPMESVRERNVAQDIDRGREPPR